MFYSFPVFTLLSVPSRSRGLNFQVNKSANFQWNLLLWGLCVLIKPQKLFYVQIKCRSCPVPLSTLCVAAVSQTNSQRPLIVSEALHAWKEECVTVISPKQIAHQRLLCENCIDWCLQWNFFVTTFYCYIVNINSSNFSRLFCYLSNTHAKYLFPPVWYNIYGSFCSHELKFSFMQQLCGILVFLLLRRHILMQLSSNNCSFSVLGMEKKCS